MLNRRDTVLSNTSFFVYCALTRLLTAKGKSAGQMIGRRLQVSRKQGYVKVGFFPLSLCATFHWPLATGVSILVMRKIS